MRRRRVGELSDRDREILAFVAAVGVASARHVERLAFPASEESRSSVLSAARRSRRVLERLQADGYLSRLERRLGGARAGSGSWLYQLGTRGKRALGQTGRGRTWQPGSRFIGHALAVADVHTQLVAAERDRTVTALRIGHEPEIWRRFSTASGVATLKPDLLVELTSADGWELRWFVEIDRATEHLPTVIRKCQLYEQYWRSGREAEHHEVFPRVLWSVPDAARARAVGAAIHQTRSLSNELFAVAAAEDIVDVLTNNNRTEGGQP